MEMEDRTGLSAIIGKLSTDGTYVHCYSTFFPSGLPPCHTIRRDRRGGSVSETLVVL